MTSSFSLRGQRKGTKRKATPNALPYGYPRYSLISFGTRINDILSLMRFRNIPVAQPMKSNNSSASHKGSFRLLLGLKGVIVQHSVRTGRFYEHISFIIPNTYKEIIRYVF